MGKAAKKRRGAARFDPLARPASTGPSDMDMQVDDGQPRKKLSAHQARHLERKRLQEEARVLKRQRGKVSKANKITCSAEKKAITKKLKAVRAEAQDLRKGGLLGVAAAA